MNERILKEINALYVIDDTGGSQTRPGTPAPQLAPAKLRPGRDAIMSICRCRRTNNAHLYNGCRVMPVSLHLAFQPQATCHRAAPDLLVYSFAASGSIVSAC